MKESVEQPELIRVLPVPHPGRWVSAGVVGLFAAGLLWSLITNPNYKWGLVAKHLFDQRVISGVGWTLVLTTAAMAIGIVLAVTVAIMRQSENPVMRSVAWFYIWFFRGTPIYTQLVFWGLISVLYPKIVIGIPFGPEFFSFDTQDVITAFVGAILGLGLNEGAYLAEIVRSGFNSVDRGQWEAATALGMNRSQIMRRIILPQAMRVIVPPTGNETISMLKTTSLVLAVPFTFELSFVTNAIGNKILEPIPLLLAAALWYLTITSILMVGQHYLEAYYGKGFDTVKRQRGSQSRSAKQRSIAETTHPDPFIDTTP